MGIAFRTAGVTPRTPRSSRPAGPGGTRRFRLIEGQPLKTSYGEDLYGTIFADDARPASQAPAARRRVGVG